MLFNENGQTKVLSDSSNSPEEKRAGRDIQIKPISGACGCNSIIRLRHLDADIVFEEFGLVDLYEMYGSIS